MWFAKSPSEVLRELQVEPAAGLSGVEAAERLVLHGKNKGCQTHQQDAQPGVARLVLRSHGVSTPRLR